MSRLPRAPWILSVIFVLALLALAAAWKWTPLAEWAHPERLSEWLEPLKTRWYGLPVVVLVFVVAEIFLFPVLVLVFVCGLVFGPIVGLVYALAGSLASALPPFLLGRHLGRARLERIGGSVVRRIAGALDGRGVLAIFLVRKVPAPFTLVNLVCGASPVSLRDFLIGTFLGMGTGVLLLTFLGTQLVDLVRDPRPGPFIGSLALLFMPFLLALATQRAFNRRAEARAGERDEPESEPKPAAPQPAVTAPAPQAPRESTAKNGSFRPGENCWRVERAERFRCVQDGDEYFRLAREAILAAQRSVFILGWDVYAAVDLDPQHAQEDPPTKLAALLDFVVRRNPKLEVYVLIWDYAALYLLERDPTSRIRLGLATHERVHFHYDDLHPLWASHHQKVIVVDDRLAFSGGLDLTSHRWDTPEHAASNPLRVTTSGEPYTPFHDVQALVEGPVAAALGELARERWTRIGATDLPPLEPRTDSLWPPNDPPDLHDVDVAIARTDPAFRNRGEVRECETLFFDEIAAAKRVIYIENQYFTNAKIGEALASRLREPDGPELVVIGPRDCSGWLEQKTMGVLRQRVLVNLEDSDKHGRLRLLHPVASKSQEVFTFIHSKVTVIDDEHLRIGSANLSNRSMGMDTECDLTAAAGGDRRIQQEIRRVRNRLVGEHLGCSADDVEEAFVKHGSLRAAIDALSSGDKLLEPVCVDREQVTKSEGLSFAADPEEPMALSRTIDRLLPALEVDDALKATRALFVAACFAGVLALGAQGVAGAETLDANSAQELLLEISADEGAIPWIFTALIAGGLLFLPFEVLVLVPVVLLGTWRGAGLAVAAGFVCATLGYLIGRALGPRRIVPLIGGRARDSWRVLGQFGALSVAVVRFVALFSATSVHLMCGAARVGVRDFTLGSVMGLAPALLASIVLGAILRNAIVDPSPTRSLVTVLVALVLAVIVLRLRRIVLMRAHGRAIREHRMRARHG